MQAPRLRAQRTRPHPSCSRTRNSSPREQDKHPKKRRPADMLSPSYCRALCLAASLASLLRTDARTGALLGQAKPEQEQHARRPPPDMPPAWPSQYTAFQVSTYPEFGATQQGYFYYDFDNMRQRVNHVTVVGAVPGVGKNTTEFWLGDQLNIVACPPSPPPSPRRASLRRRPRPRERHREALVGDDVAADGSAPRAVVVRQVDWTDRSCQRVNMGFSIPRPTWFQTNSTLAPVTQWLLHAPPAAAAAHSGDDDGYSNPFSTLAQPPSGSRAAVPTYHEVVWLSKEDVFGLPPFNYYAL
eukprot:scaffold1390_cov234-Prasinococcus_capsulatus_cf.AAC.4